MRPLWNKVESKHRKKPVESPKTGKNFCTSSGYHGYILDIPTNFSFHRWWKCVFSGIVSGSNDPRDSQMFHLYRLKSWLARNRAVLWEKNILRLSLRPLGMEKKVDNYIHLPGEIELDVYDSDIKLLEALWGTAARHEEPDTFPQEA